MSTEEWRRMHRGYAENHARVPSETFLTLLDERDVLEAEANRIATLLGQVGDDRRKLNRQVAGRQTALVDRITDLRALLSVQDANHGACIERCEQLEDEVQKLQEGRKCWWNERQEELLRTIDTVCEERDRAEKLAAKMFAAAMNSTAPMIRAVDGKLTTDDLEAIAGYVKDNDQGAS